MRIHKKKAGNRKKGGRETSKDKLNGSRNFLQQLLNTSSHSIYAYNLKHKNIVYANNYSSIVLGYTPTQMLQYGDDFFIGITHAEDLPELQKHYKDISELKDGEIRSLDIRVKHANGNWVRLNLKESVLKRNKKGEVQKITGNAFEIKEKKEDRLNEERHFINSMIDVGFGNVFVFDLINERVLFERADFLQTLGYTNEQYNDLGNWFSSKVVYDEDIDIVKSTLQEFQYLKEDRTLIYKARFLHADGSLRWFQVNLRPFKRDDQGRIMEAMGIAEDITQYKEAEIRLKENQKLIEKIVATSPSDIFVFDLVKNKNVFASMNVLNTLGYTPEQVEKMGDQFLPTLLHPEDVEVMDKNFQELEKLRTDKTLTVEVRLRHAKGNWRWISTNSRPFKRNKEGVVTQVVGIAVDITERKNAEIQLKEAKHFIDEIIATSPNDIYVYDLIENKNIFINKNILDSLGYSQEQIAKLGDQFASKLLHPDDVDIVKNNFKDLKGLESDQTLSIEVRFKHANGSWRWTCVNERPFKRDKKGNVIQIVGVGIDITKRKEAEIKLKETQHFIDKVLATSPNDIFVYDLIEDKNIFANRNHLETMGYSPEEVYAMGRNFLANLVHPEDLPLVRKKLHESKHMRENEIRSVVFRIKHVNGGWRWIEARVTPFKRNERGEVTQISGIGINITALKQVEMQLEESRYFFERIMDATPSIIHVYDVQEHKDIYENRRFSYSPQKIEKLDERSLKEIVHPEDYSALISHYEALVDLKDSEISKFEVRFMHPDGSWHWYVNHQKVFKRDEKGNIKKIIEVIVDITQRKDAEDKLKEREHFINKVTDAVPHFIIVHDVVKHKNIFSNYAHQKRSGFRKENIESFDIHSLIHPDDLQAFIEHEKKVLTMGDDDVLELEYRIKNEDGAYRWENGRVKVLKRTEEGEVQQIVVSAIDITDRKKAEEKLNESKRFIEKMTEAAPDLIYVFDLLEKRNIYINKSSFKMLGYSHEEINQMGDNFFPQLMHPDDIPKSMENIEKLRKFPEGKVNEIEFRLRDSEGRWHWYVARNNVFQRDETDKVTQIAGIATDITYIKKIEEQLKDLNNNLEEKVNERTIELEESREHFRNSEHQLKIITNAIPVFISYIDKNETYQFGNPYYKKLLNVSGEIKGKSIKEIVGAEAYSISKENIKKALKGEEVSFENRLKMSDGSVRTINVTYIPDKDAKGRVRGFVAMGVDLTDRISYEKNLENKNLELKRINNDLDSFIYTASHDLKAPIANLEGLLSFIKEDIKGRLSEDAMKVFNMMNDSLSNLKTTITELTEISKIQRNHVTDKDQLDINSFIEEFKIEHSVQIKNSKAIITAQLEVPSIWFSKKNFRSILYNLLDNAIKFRSPDRVPEVLVKTEENNKEFVLLSIKDNGLGFDISKKRKVFGMFKRMHSGIEGTGMGLYIVKKIVENSGGKVDVESKKSKGSVFKIYFKKDSKQ